MLTINKAGIKNTEKSSYTSEKGSPEKNKFLAFRLGHEYYGIEMKYLTVVIEVDQSRDKDKPTALINEVVNMWSKLFPIIYLRGKFNKEYDEFTKIILLNVNESPLGIIVDQTYELFEISDEQLEYYSAMNDLEYPKYVEIKAETSRKAIILLDVNRLLQEELGHL